VTISVSVVSVVIGKAYERKLVVERELREKKMPTYMAFVEHWFKTLHAGRTAKKDAGVENGESASTIEFFVTFTQNVLMWGSDDVVARWSKLRRRFITEPNSVETFLEFEQLLLAMRRDTGHSNQGLARGDVLGLFVNDIENLVTPRTDQR